MNYCTYCGEANPSTVFNCLKCNALMPSPVIVENIPVVQDRTRKPVRIQEQPLPLEPKPFTEPTSLKDLSIYAGSAFLVIALFVAMFYFLNKYEPFSGGAPAKTASPETVSSETGYYLDYKFTLTKKGSDDKVVALFQPKMLPHSDVALVGATQKVISQAYGKEVSGNPVLTGNEIKFTSGKESFYVMPIKEDTGEIHTLVIRR